MDLTNLERLPSKIFAIISSIINRSGSTLADLSHDTLLTEVEIEKLITSLIYQKKINFGNDSKYYIAETYDWQFWKDEVELTQNDERLERRSLWLKNSPTKDWWPNEDIPKPELIYFIGPYREPYLSLYFLLIKPLIEKMGFVCSTSLEEPGSKEFLRNKILPGLKNARYVICDLSERNVNVHYEKLVKKDLIPFLV